MNRTSPFVARLAELSPFAQRALEADPDLRGRLLEGCRQPFAREAMQGFLDARECADEAALRRHLRQIRTEVLMRLMLRDLNGLADLGEVVRGMTDLAEVCIGCALDRLDPWLAAQYGEPVSGSGARQRLIVVGMGKLGGRELNVSSDIDLVLAYEEDGETGGERPVSNHEYFSRLGRKLIGVLHDVTADGFVFRVDMRLRPYGDSGPLVNSLLMLEEYYQTQGREWERYAWAKGRVICGPEQGIMQLLRPFVYRKYLDYGAFASMRELKAQIGREVARREMHDNIKLGPGGIREVEFIAQVFQLIRGGQDSALQVRGTQELLDLLGRRKLLPPQAVEQLQQAYVFLRRLEHRIQYLQDAQTHLLPADGQDRARIAEGMGLDGWEAFSAALAAHRTLVQSLFEEVFSEPEAAGRTAHALAPLWQGTLPEGEAEAVLNDAGYRDAAAVRARLVQLTGGTKYRQLSAASRQRFDTLAPLVIEAAAGFPNPDVTLARMFDLLESICRRASYLALLAEYPQTLTLVARLASASPWLADYLQQHPLLLDELLDTDTLYAVPDFPGLAGELERRLAGEDEDVERQMDILRHFKQAQVFRCAAQDLTGELRLETLSDYLSALADMMLEATLCHAWKGLRGRHSERPRFAVIGYGKLGGKELGYASDLDIVFLYDDDAASAGEIYARFGQRVTAWLNRLTPAGVLYETDFRLRPDGASGLLVSSLQGFAEYQLHKAWTWEHQALTRARFCAGDQAIGAAFENLRQQVLCQRRDPAKLREEVVVMRRKMQDGHPNHTPLFDLKHDSGGIVDVEFIVQYLVLAHASSHRELLGNLGNIALLRIAGELELIPAGLALAAADAYREYRREQHRLRLQGEEKARSDPQAFAGQRQAVDELWQLVLGGEQAAT